MKLETQTITISLALVLVTTTFSPSVSAMASTSRTVKHIQPTVLHTMKPGFSARSLRVDYASLMDPFVNLDNFFMDRPIFPPHPHAGFSAVTYMFEDSEGSFLNQWSKGPEKEVIQPGALHWTQAGSGMMHEEVPTVTGKSCHGLQMFVKLPADQELSKPQAFHIKKDDVPEWKSEDGDARVRVLTGSYHDEESPFTPGNGKDLTYLDVHVKKNAKIKIPAPHDTTAFLLSIKGSLTAFHDKDTTAIAEYAGAFFESDGDSVKLQASGDGDSQFLFCGGTPNKEPLVSGGPFMMSTQERITQAKRDYGSGAMGHFEPLDVAASTEL